MFLECFSSFQGARIYKARGGPYDGHWFYPLQADEQGRPWSTRDGLLRHGQRG